MINFLKPYKDRSYKLLAFILFFSVLVSRRWQQLINPQVWNEDGAPGPITQVLRDNGSVIPDYISSGWTSLFESVNGYLIIIPKIISIISINLSFFYYPEISTTISFLFATTVCMLIMVCPTYLKMRFLCAIAVLLIPSNTEVFGTPLYTFWWASLLLFLIALWDEKSPSVALRSLFLIIGGLSSPIIFLILPILYLRVYWFANARAEKFIAFVATIITLVQFIFFTKNTINEIPLFSHLFFNSIKIFFGGFLIGNLISSKLLLFISSIFLFGIIILWLHTYKHIKTTWILTYLLAGSVALVVTRVDILNIDQSASGPRYFFFPFILIYWILIQFFYLNQSNAIRAFIATIFITSILNATPVWTRNHDDLRWRDHVNSCPLFTEYLIPIHRDGNSSSTWHLELSGNTCTKLLDNQFIIANYRNLNYQTFPFTIHKANWLVTAGDHHSPELISSSMPGTDFQKSKLKNYQVIGTARAQAATTGEVLLKLKRGDRLYYRSGPGKIGQSLFIVNYEDFYFTKLPVAIDWTILDFSNISLPDEFLVKIIDTSSLIDDWSAVAIKSK